MSISKFYKEALAWKLGGGARQAGIATYAINPLTGGISGLAGPNGKVYPQLAAKTLQPYTQQVWEYGDGLGLDYSLIQTEACAGGPFSAVQIIIGGKYCSGLQASFAASDILNDTINPKSAGGNVTPTLFTWGTTDPNDFSNPGGGQVYGTISGSQGSPSIAPITSNFSTGYAVSDWMPCASLARTDIPANNPLLFLRWYAPLNGNSANAIVSNTNSGTTATLTVTSAHGLNPGQQIIVSGATPAAYNGTFTLATASGTTMTYVMASNPGGVATVLGNWQSPTTVTIGQTPNVLIPAGNRVPGYRDRTGDGILTGRPAIFPETSMAYYTNNNILTSTGLSTAGAAGFSGGVVPDTSNHYTAITVRYLLANAGVNVLGNYGDSQAQGFTSDAASASAAGLNSYVVRLRDLFVGAGVKTSVLNKAITSDWSYNFHQRCAADIRNRLCTHYFIPMQSVNDTNQNTDANVRARAYNRVRNLVKMAYNAGAKPIIIENWSGNTNTTAAAANLAFANELTGYGVQVVSIPSILCQADRVTLQPAYVAGADTAHWNAAGHASVAAAIYAAGI